MSAILEARGIVNRFGKQTVHDGIDLEVKRGEILGIAGGSGSGKSVLMRTLTGLKRPDRGKVTIEDKPVDAIHDGEKASLIGVLFQQGALFSSLSVAQNVMLPLREHTHLKEADRESVASMKLEMAGLEAKDGAKLPSQLSGGMVKRAALARALALDPRILFLDEPTSGLDPEVTRSVRLLLDERRAAGCSILVSTHNLDEAERLADRVAVLDERLVAIDDPAALRGRLTTGRTIVRVAGDPSACIPAIRALVGPAVDIAVERSTIALQLTRPDRQTPALVASLVAAGAEILEVRAEMPALEDVYVHLMGGDGGGA